MLPYEFYSGGALELELRNIEHIKMLVKEMEKPSNFTYIDVLNLHNHLDMLQRCIEHTIKERRNGT